MPTSLASMVADVITITNRPDLVAETALAVRAATIKAHQKDDWIKDLKEYSIAFSTSDYYQSLDYKAVIPNWRKPRYVRKLDSTGLTEGSFLTYIEPEKVIDNFSADRTDVYYVAGAYLQIRSSAVLQYISVGIYENPVATAVGYNSWIADDHPFAIIYEAAAIVFKSIGFDEQVPMFRELCKEEYATLTRHATTGTGN